MDRIICLTGASGVGKSTIARKLKNSFGYNFIKSYTTRLRREFEDEDNHTFVSKHERRASPFDVIACDVYAGNEYWATRDMYQGKGDSLYVINPRIIESLKKQVNDAEIITIFINLDMIEREKRLLSEYTEKGINLSTHERVQLYKDIKNRLCREMSQYYHLATDFYVYNHMSEDSALVIDEFLTGRKA